MLETGYFTNRDTAINNYAGIAHYDDAASGSAFRDPLTGVRAQIQLLKKFALGNDAPLANIDVAPNAGASATTWGGLAGTWASSPTYWTSLSSLYEAMLAHAGIGPDDLEQYTALGSGACPTGNLAISGDYALPVERRWYDEHPDWFTQPHHDYPAIDIPVPVGTPVYAVTNGVVVATPTAATAGSASSSTATTARSTPTATANPAPRPSPIGDHVTVGQYLMDSASTGNSTGPHLHFSIEADGAYRCPQPFLVAIADGRPGAPDDLPTTGCVE